MADCNFLQIGKKRYCFFVQDNFTFMSDIALYLSVRVRLYSDGPTPISARKIRQK